MGDVGFFVCHCTAQWPNSWTMHIAIAKIMLFLSFFLSFSVSLSFSLAVVRRSEKIRLTYMSDGVCFQIQERAWIFSFGPNLNLTDTCLALPISVLISAPNFSNASLAAGRLTKRSAIFSEDFRSNRWTSLRSKSILLNLIVVGAAAKQRK